jgi:hypothetical protein
MVEIVNRTVKGKPLTFGEVDGNFSNLNDGKEKTINSMAIDTVMNQSDDYIAFYDTAAASVKKITPINSVFFNRTVIIKVLPDALPTYVADGLAYFTVPLSLNGLYLSGVVGELGAHVYTAGTGAGTFTTVMIHNLTNAEDILLPGITIDATETDSKTAVTAPSIISGRNQVSTADVLRFDITAVNTAEAVGLEVRMQFKGA